MLDRNELLAQAVDRAVLKGLMRPSAATDLVLLYRGECVIEPENDRVTLHNLDLDKAVEALIKARPHWQPDKPKTNRVDIEVERAALLADHKDWGASEKPPVDNKPTPHPNNPFSKEHWNVTRQMQLFKANPKACAEIAAAVGSYPGATHPIPNYSSASGDRHVDAIADRERDVKNPWTREGWNKTQQGVLFKKLGAAKCAELAEAAGVTLHSTRPA
jgi:hypothetical protein